MKKKDIVTAIYENSSYQKQVIEDIVNETFKLMALGLIEDGKVMISDFGTFEKVYQKEYFGVNPATGERMMIKGSNKVGFSMGKKLKDDLNQGK